MNDTKAPHIASMQASNAGSSTSMQPKKLKFLTMMGICVGLVIVQGSMISATQGIGIGGMGFIAAMIVAFVLAQFNAMSFAELSLMFPEAGTLATYTQKAIGHFPAIVAVFAGYVVVAMLALPVEMFLVETILGELFPGMFPPLVLPLLILCFLAVTNLLGADLFAKVQNLLSFVLVTALVLIGLCAVTGAVEPHVAVSGTPVSWSFEPVLNGSFIGLVAMAMWLMVGVEFICPMINEVDNPQRNIPRAMMLSLCAMLAIFLLFVFGASFYLSVETLTTAPLPYLEYAHAVFGKSGLIIAAVMALTATCSTINTVLAAVPRMLQGMAENGQAFPQLKITSARYGTPWVGILFVASIISIPFLLMDIDSLIPLVIAASTSWLLAYVVAHIDVIVLRRRMPNMARPFKTPFYPLPQVIGIVAMLYVAMHNSPSPEMTAMVYKILGVILLIISVIGALWVKLYMKRKLFEPDLG
ncbi:Proline-specific permease ProY [Pseudomonas sp. Bi70]|uniref:APC family permease n=1 Tax=Pseudomonas sp. Bi70 TaxID=2821127 RepID=UPI001E06BC77|nr:APC family permease [Pseudomonas sp. Bi70]CAH0142507.1 Proline-specific permease ProY [Pseudomonas sp. Bi70]